MNAITTMTRSPCNFKIRQDYKASDVPTIVENIGKEKDVQAAFVEDAVIGVGPYELASSP